MWSRRILVKGEQYLLILTFLSILYILMDLKKIDGKAWMEFFWKGKFL